MLNEGALIFPSYDKLFPFLRLISLSFFSLQFVYDVLGLERGVPLIYLSTWFQFYRSYLLSSLPSIILSTKWLYSLSFFPTRLPILLGSLRFFLFPLPFQLLFGRPPVHLSSASWWICHCETLDELIDGRKTLNIILKVCGCERYDTTEGKKRGFQSLNCSFVKGIKSFIYWK